MMLLVHLNSPEYQGWSEQGKYCKATKQDRCIKALDQGGEFPVTLNSQEGMTFLAEFCAEVTVAFLQGKASVQWENIQNH